MSDVVPCLANPAWKRRAKERLARMRARRDGSVEESVRVKARAIVEALIEGKKP